MHIYLVQNEKSKVYVYKKNIDTVYNGWKHSNKSETVRNDLGVAVHGSGNQDANRTLVFE